MHIIIGVAPSPASAPPSCSAPEAPEFDPAPAPAPPLLDPLPVEEPAEPEPEDEPEPEALPVEVPVDAPLADPDDATLFLLLPQAHAASAAPKTNEAPTRNRLMFMVSAHPIAEPARQIIPTICVE
jgi:hypothetical protein